MLNLHSFLLVGGYRRGGGGGRGRGRGGRRFYRGSYRQRYNSDRRDDGEVNHDDEEQRERGPRRERPRRERREHNDREEDHEDGEGRGRGGKRW